YIPEDMILAETDSPFASPVPKRGQRNSPLYVKHVADRIAQIKDLEPGMIQKTLVDNVLRVFNIQNRI
ncbi:hypothetical protein COW81_00695, partial [Candidatus Campbellbacteria bacterium CG22_combo_CG10-13_8_21_14_all_36_13]